MDKSPKVTFVIPTLNEEKFIGQCLDSIGKQDYPRDCIEVIVADGGSTDRTRDIAEKHSCTVLDNPKKLAEPGKQLAFSKASGDYIALLDADNEIADPTWLTRAIAALEKHPDALGFESYYLKKKGHSLLNRYLTALLQISDPCAVKMAGKMTLLSSSEGIQVFDLPADGSYPTGANGFVFRKELLSRLPEDAGYHEATFFPGLMRDGTRKLIKIEKCGVYHSYVTTMADFYRKRQRAMIIYKLRTQGSSENWDTSSRGLKTFLVVLYNATIAGPLIEGLIKAIYKKDPDWLIHPAASLISVLGNIKGILSYYSLASDDKRESASTDMSNINRN